MANSNRRVLIMAGGTGGHVFPALAVADELQSRGVDVSWLGTAAGIEHRVVPEAGIPLHEIDIVGLRGKGLGTWLKMPWLLLRAVWQASRVIKMVKPQVVLGLGGFASGPGALVAKMQGIPLVLHEQNAVAGTTNKWLSRLTPHRLTAFPNSLPRSVHVGNPIRSSIIKRFQSRQRATDTTATRNLLVLGGSLGARSLNQLLPQACQLLIKECNVKVWHQSGEAHWDETQRAYQSVGVSAKVEPFIQDMAEAYEWADLVVCRAGALTVSEITAVGVAALFVPFPHAIDDHQRFNAKWLVDNGAAYMILENELDKDNLVKKLKEMFANVDQLRNMALRAHNLAKLDAASLVADKCMEVARG